MTIGRLTGDGVVKAVGGTRILVVGSLVSATGFVLTVFASMQFLALASFLLVALGASNIVPVLYTAAGAQSRMPASLAIASVTTIGYTGILMGPAAIGGVAHHRQPQHGAAYGRRGTRLRCGSRASNVASMNASRETAASFLRRLRADGAISTSCGHPRLWVHDLVMAMPLTVVTVATAGVARCEAAGGSVPPGGRNLDESGCLRYEFHQSLDES